MSVMKIVFFVNRYLPFLDCTAGVAMIVGAQKKETCHALWTFVVLVYPIGSFLSEVILMVRTMALWGFSRMILGIMVVNTLVLLVPTIAVAQRYLRNLRYPESDVLQITRCVASISDGEGWVFYLSIIISETTVVTLTLLKQYLTAVRGSAHPRLLRTMYRDGTVFYIMLLCVSIANLICMKIAPVWVSSVLQLPHRAMHSTLCSRVLLNLRKAAARSSGLSLDDFNRRSHLVFEGPLPCHDDSMLALSESSDTTAVEP
ncbi:hypothetical protein C8Q77DRAFT_1106044 [Trametes polyzona]|nr:hypothetical protein C8Q77DRAFT_1106044 [Trametes polyzona]